MVIDGSKIFITNAGTDITACVTITALTGDGEISNIIVPNGTPGYVVSARWRSWVEGVRYRELSFQACVSPKETCSAARRRLHPVPEDPRRGRISVAAMASGSPKAVRPRVRVREGARAVGKPNLEVPGGAAEARRHGDRDRSGALPRLQGGVGERPGSRLRRTAAMAKLYSGELSHRAANWAFRSTAVTVS